MDTRKVARAVILVAIGVALSPFTSIPIGIAKINPVQHFVNVLGAVLLGPWWATGIALITGILRNALGTGTLLAFPGGMIGAFIAGFFYRYYSEHLYSGTRRDHWYWSSWSDRQCLDCCSRIDEKRNGHGRPDHHLLWKFPPRFDHRCFSPQTLGTGWHRQTEAKWDVTQPHDSPI